MYEFHVLELWDEGTMQGRQSQLKMQLQKLIIHTEKPKEINV